MFMIFQNKDYILYCKLNWDISIPILKKRIVLNVRFICKETKRRKICEFQGGPDLDPFYVEFLAAPLGQNVFVFANLSKSVGLRYLQTRSEISCTKPNCQICALFAGYLGSTSCVRTVLQGWFFCIQ
jgi:hypothetical protein